MKKTLFQIIKKFKKNYKKIIKLTIKKSLLLIKNKKYKELIKKKRSKIS